MRYQLPSATMQLDYCKRAGEYLIGRTRDGYTTCLSPKLVEHTFQRILTSIQGVSIVSRSNKIIILTHRHQAYNILCHRPDAVVYDSTVYSRPTDDGAVVKIMNYLQPSSRRNIDTTEQYRCPYLKERRQYPHLDLMPFNAPYMLLQLYVCILLVASREFGELASQLNS